MCYNTRSQARFLLTRTIVSEAMNLSQGRGVGPLRSTVKLNCLADRKIAMVGSGPWALEVMGPNIQTDSAAYCHMNLIVRRGITNFENLDLDVLSEAKACEFLRSPVHLVAAQAHRCHGVSGQSDCGLASQKP